MALSDHLTLKQPLGPIDQSIVWNAHDAAELLDGVPPFLGAMEQRAAIIIGRRGAGKSAVLHGYRSLARYGYSHGHFSDEVLDGRDVVIPFFNWERFHTMAQGVGRELSIYQRQNPELSDFLFTEATSEIWESFIWDSIFTNVHASRRQGRLVNDDNTLSAITDYFSGTTIAHTDLLYAKATELFTNARDGLISYLRLRQKTCYVLFDNMDEYPIRNPLIENVMSGFLRAVHMINANYTQINIIVCIPEEVEAYLQTHSANIEKDFSNTYRLRWRPIDLLRIICYRYRCFIEIHDPEFHKQIKKYDFSIRSDVIELLKRILPKCVSNELGYREHTLSYIIRHTQLIPRHFIILFTEILMKSHEVSGGFRTIDEESVVAGVAEGERKVARQVLKPYVDIYPRLIASCEELLANLPPICGESDLDKLRTRFKQRVEDDIADMWRKLYEIGVIGMVEPQDYKGDTSEGKYVLAKFHFNSSSNFGKTDRRSYCVHPIFSKYFGLTRADSNMMAVYPKDLPEEW